MLFHFKIVGQNSDETRVTNLSTSLFFIMIIPSNPTSRKIRGSFTVVIFRIVTIHNSLLFFKTTIHYSNKKNLKTFQEMDKIYSSFDPTIIENARIETHV